MKSIIVAVLILVAAPLAQARPSQLIIETRSATLTLSMVRIDDSIPGTLIFFGQHQGSTQLIGCQVTFRHINKAGTRPELILKHLDLSRKPDFVCQETSPPKVTSKSIIFETTRFSLQN